MPDVPFSLIEHLSVLLEMFVVVVVQMCLCVKKEREGLE